MNYQELMTELETAANNAGFGYFESDFLSVLNEKVSKTYPALLIFPVKSKINLEVDNQNTFHTIAGFAADLTEYNASNMQAIEDKLRAFVNELSGIVEQLEIERIPREATDRLIGIKFSFEYIVTDCSYND